MDQWRKDARNEPVIIDIGSLVCCYERLKRLWIMSDCTLTQAISKECVARFPQKSGTVGTMRHPILIAVFDVCTIYTFPQVSIL